MNNPATLIISNKQQTNIFIEKNLKNIFCENKTESCNCIECRKITSNQHESIVKITPNKKYLISDIAIVFEKIKFKLETKKQFFFVLEDVHLLTSSCANKLLKTLEEPPSGYKFLLTTNNENLILPTIKSRCQIHYLSNKTENIENPIIEFFCGTKKDPIEFDQELKNQNLSESETIELVNEIINKFQKQYVSYQKNCSTGKDIEQLEKLQDYKHIKSFMNFLKKQLESPPQQGSVILFLKNLFLNFPHVNS